jgi:hemoglobin-like flavoprotein
MTNFQMQLVRQSWQKAGEEPLRLAILFYDRLFETAPELRAYFRTPMSMQTGMLMKMFGYYINKMNKPACPVSMVQDFGFSTELGPDQLSCITETLLITVKNILSPEWDESLQDAWLAFCSGIIRSDLAADLAA